MKANIGLAAAAGIAMLAASATTGAQIVLYEHDNYSGRSVQATNSVSNLADSGFNDQASSVIVRNGRWQICSDAYFGGRIDVIVNNAGTIRDAQLIKMSEQNFDLVIAINLKGVFNCSQAVAQVMVAQGSGVILSTSSLVAPYGNYGQTNYVASKAGVVGMTKVWARELGRKGIRANAVAPGFIETRMTAGIPEPVVDKLLERIAMGRFGKPEDIANAFVWLASDEARYVSGQVIGVDGGATL